MVSLPMSQATRAVYKNQLCLYASNKQVEIKILKILLIIAVKIWKLRNKYHKIGARLEIYKNTAEKLNQI